MIRLRGHHLFCCTLFQGSGYDGTFASRMAQVMERLQAGEEICLVEGCDDVCAACPNRRGAAGCALGSSCPAGNWRLSGRGIFPWGGGEKTAGRFPGTVGDCLRLLPLERGGAVLLGAFCAASFPALCVKFPIEGGSWKKTGPPSAFLKMLLLSEGEYTKIGVSKSGILFKICVLCL